MKKDLRLLLIILLCLFCVSESVFADAKAQLTKESRLALQNLFKNTPAAKKLASGAKGILVFPKITKGGFLIGAQYGRGTLFKDGKVAGYYSTAAASYGLQAGLQKFGYALIFLEDKDLEYIDRSGGWELGVGPSITVVDEGIARALTTTTAREGVYAFFFAQQGLMAGLGVQGSKITKIDPNS